MKFSLGIQSVLLSLCAAALMCLSARPLAAPQQTSMVQTGRGGGVYPQTEADDTTGFVPIFDGKTLNSWDGDTTFWRVENGEIIGETTPEKVVKLNNFLIWRGGTVKDFELKVEFRMNGTNSGIQYRSSELPNIGKWVLKGYQADFDFAGRYTGQLYEQNSPRGIIAWRGQVVATEPDKKPTLLATLGTSDELKAVVKPGQWNQVEIIADGNTLTHIINGRIMAVLVDTDTKFSQAKGLIAVEIEGPGKVKISHRNIWLKKLP